MYFLKNVTFFKCWSTDDQFFSTCSTTCRSAGYDKLLFRDRHTEQGVELINYFTEQSSSEAKRFSASQEIPNIFWEPKVHYRIHKFPPPVLILSQFIPSHSTS
jgi:hypothetical protein